MAVALNDLVQVKVYNRQSNQAGINVFHYKVTGVVGTSVEESHIALKFDTVLAPQYRPMMAVVATYVGVGARVVRPVITPEQFSATLTAGGLAAGDPLPKQVCGISTWRTAVVGSRGRGRSYWPFPAEGSNDTDSTPIAAYLTAMAALTTVLLTVQTVIRSAGNSADLTLALYHRVAGTSDPILSVVNRDRWATQRRRGDYGRTNLLPI